MFPAANISCVPKLCYQSVYCSYKGLACEDSRSYTLHEYLLTISMRINVWKRTYIVTKYTMFAVT
jgi:hypothetical protein